MSNFPFRIYNLRAIILLGSMMMATYFIQAQNFATNLGAKASALGNSSVASVDAWSCTNNQGAMAFAENTQVGLFYENRFLSNALNSQAIAFTLPIKKGVFGVNFAYSGFQLYNEKKAGLGYALRLNDFLGVGVQLDYWNTAIGNDYGSKSLFTFEVGVMAKVSSKINLGVHVFNPIRAQYNTYDDERLESLYKLGLQWEIAENLNFVAEAQSNIDNKLFVGGGVEYRILEILYARIGMGTHPEIFSFGFGLKLQSFHLDFSSSYHQVLGYSPQVSMHYVFNK